MKRCLFFCLYLIPYTLFFIPSFAQPVISYWDKESTLKKSEENFKNGIQHGRFAQWFKNGQLAKEGNYDMGAEEGVWKAWFEDGKLKSEGIISKGMIPKLDNAFDALKHGVKSVIICHAKNLRKVISKHKSGTYLN